MRKVIVALIAVAFSGLAGTAMAQSSEGRVQTLDELLELVREGRTAESAEHRQREREFQQRQNEQNNLLRDAEATRTAEERRSEQFEATFAENERLIGQLQTQLDERLGSLKELFGVIQQVAGDARATFEQSIISAQYPGRGESLTDLIEKVSGGSRLPSIGEIEDLWYQVQREMTESGKVVAFNTEVILPDGAREEREVVRVGTFNLVSDGRYLQFLDNSGAVAELVRQPAGRFLSSAGDVQEATGSGDLVEFAVDPSRGSILGLLVQAPSLRERIDQ
ncbi:MAG: hypothetical protein WEB93_00995, partial [Sphingomonadales bacterium]